MSGWIELAPGVWVHPEPIDEEVARALMEQRLAERGIRLHRRVPFWTRLRAWLAS